MQPKEPKRLFALVAATPALSRREADRAMIERDKARIARWIQERKV